MQEFHYRLPGRARGLLPGFHRSDVVGGGLDFYQHAPLLAFPDPRRIDLRATLRDPFGQLKVRLLKQKSAVEVHVLADLSASMSFGRKAVMLSEFSAAAAYSAYRTGDRFGFLGFAEDLRAGFTMAARHARAPAGELAGKLPGAATGTGAQGVLQAAERLSHRRSLVMLVSDFHFDHALLESALRRLQEHIVVPVALWDSREYRHLPDGIIRLRDPETGRARTLWMRKALREKIQARFLDRRRALERLCADLVMPLLVLTDRFEPDHVTQYFLDHT